MDPIDDPTNCERIKRGITKPIINSKQKFGLGLKKPKKALKRK
jgi:hypothetical protein